jgi:hypothetical protein
MLRIHPDNPKLFEFRGKPLVLLTATEHYGAVMNRPFQFEKYLADAAEKGMTLTRLFMLFRELQTPVNPYSTCKPESPDYVAPFTRTGPGRALDEELKFDLDKPNPEFFDRLHRFVGLAGEYGIIVEVVLLSQTYAPQVWVMNPLNAKNNVNDVEDIPWPDYVSGRHPKLFARQAAHVRKIVTELNQYDNVLYEICNEPGGNVPGEGNPTTAEVNEWLAALITVVRETEAGLPNRHLIAGQEATSSQPDVQGTDGSIDALDYDVVNIHALHSIDHRGRHYHLGDFMSKQLRLRALRDYNLATYPERKPLNQDEDNIASQYKDIEAWTIYRKRAWTTLLTGAHFDVIDFSIINYCEAGTPESRAHMRTWFGYLSRFIHSFDLARARPLPGVVLEQPAHTLEVVFGVEREDIAIYLADERELRSARGMGGDARTLGDEGRRTEDEAQDKQDDRRPATGDQVRAEDEAWEGGAIEGEVVVALPEGTYEASVFDPQRGQYSLGVTVKGDPAGTRLRLPRFWHDVAVRVRRVSA